MLISFSKKFIFIHNPKAAGSSITKALKKYQPLYLNFLTLNYEFYNNLVTNFMKSIPDILKNDYLKSVQISTHATAQNIRNTLSEDIYNNFYKFGFVRNPLELEVSRYFYILLDSKHWAHLNVKNMKDFDEYIEWRCNDKNIISKQKHMFTDENNTIIVDYVGKLENISEDFQYILEQIGLEPIQLPHVNKSDHKSYREYYNDFSRKLVEEHCKEDIELFGYEF